MKRLAPVALALFVALLLVPLALLLAVRSEEARQDVCVCLERTP